MPIARLGRRLRSSSRPAAEPPEEARTERAEGRPELAEAERLVAQGDLVAAVDVLAAANRRARAAELELRLADLRRAAGEALVGRGEGRQPWPPRYPDPFPDVSGRLPEVHHTGLTTEVLGGAVAHHGALVVRGLFSPEQAARAVEVIDLAHDALARFDGLRDVGDEGFRPVHLEPMVKTQVLRSMVGRQGGIWLGDSPVATELVLGSLHDVGLVDVMAEHFGERPLFSLQKSTLRRSPPEWNLVAWHQDGSFLDPEVRTMNVWVSLTPCGGDLPTPGLEVVPRRFDDILPVDGVMSPHSISYDLVDEIAAETPTAIPRFDAGDALLFDEHFLHRTHLAEGMTDPRYALECWFFAPSHHTPDYLPLLV